MTDKKVIKTEPRYTAPCAPGDTVYVVNCDYSGAYVRDRTITRVAFETDNNPRDSFTKGAIGKNVFLDREEAETTAASDAAKKLVEQAKADHEAYQDYIVYTAKEQSEADKLKTKDKTCRDCIHHDVCTLADDARFKDDIRKHCENYKDKALCIWPPCRVGDAIYVIVRTSRGDEIALGLVEGIIVNRWCRDNDEVRITYTMDYAMYDLAFHDKETVIWPQEDEDPYVFMSYEAAEAELERRRKREAGKQQLNEREEDKS